ncbi:MAG: hypothetical protein FWD59_09690, partial [Micrococcales bacterium]|nr:hypothetical protein [Micrococcales bacterium]
MSITAFVNGTKDDQWKTAEQTQTGSDDLITDARSFYRTNDGWFRLQSGRTDYASTVLYDTPFPSNQGFTVSFDYRSVKIGTSDVEVGGLAMYLVDGEESIKIGAARGALGYAMSNYGGAWGINGYLALGLSSTGSWAFSGHNYGGNDDFFLGNKQHIGLRGSGNARAVPSEDRFLLYPWAGGVEFPVYTKAAGGNPVSDANSEYRRIQITGRKLGQTMEVVVKAADAVRKDQPSNGMKEYFRGNLNDPTLAHYKYPQSALPKTLKLGFSTSSGYKAAAYIDIRNVRIDVATDVEVTGKLDPSVPGMGGGKYARGDKVAFEWTATNHGPAPVGTPASDPDSVARLKSDMQSLSQVLDFSTATWTCTPIGGASCETASGTGIDALVDFRAPADGAVKLRVEAQVRSDAPLGTHRAK